MAEQGRGETGESTLPDGSVLINFVDVVNKFCSGTCSTVHQRFPLTDPVNARSLGGLQNENKMRDNLDL